MLSSILFYFLGFLAGFGFGYGSTPKPKAVVDIDEDEAIVLFERDMAFRYDHRRDVIH